MKLSLLDELTAARAAKQPVALATWLDGRDQRVVTKVTAPAGLAEAVGDVLRLDQARVIDLEGGVLIEPHNPPPRLVIIGAVHIAESLAKLGTLAGFAVTIVDPRRAWATPERFGDQHLLLEWPDRGIEKLALDPRSAVVTLTHDPKLDDPALVAALETPAFYIGCLGSKKTHASRLERLAAAGCTGLERLHGPVGLKIGARAPAEIAISIVA
ncbi:hypothetical protein BH11MYX1_BH11MYX1_39340 [soil metagenome]